MTRRWSMLAVLTLVAAAAGVAAQQTPDFTGSWKLVGEAPDAFTPTQIVVTSDGTLLTVTTTGQMGDIKTTYKLDGAASSSPLDLQGMTIDRQTTMKRTGDRLTLTSTSDMNGQAMAVSSVITAGPDGTMVVETTFPDFQGGGAPITTKATYKKS
jgi:hypothetical protein